MSYRLREYLRLYTNSYVIINVLLSFQRINGELSTNVWDETTGHNCCDTHKAQRCWDCTFLSFFFFFKSTVQHTVRQVLKASSGDVSPLAKRRNYSRRLDRTNTPQFIQEVQNIIGMTPGIHTRAIGIDLRFSEDAIRNAMHDDISYTSYVTRKS